jgi:hypothetical protein
MLHTSDEELRHPSSPSSISPTIAKVEQTTNYFYFTQRVMKRILTSSIS